MDKIKIGISAGDINGIGLEVTLKTLTNENILKYCTPIIYASTKVVSYHKNIAGVEFPFQVIKDMTSRPSNEKVNIINCWQDNVSITLGKASEEGGKFAYIALEKAVHDLRDGHLDALVTAPINKEAMKMASFPYPGHTEYLAQQLGGKDLMLMLYEDLRIGVATNHVPVSEVSAMLTKEVVEQKLHTMDHCLKMDFGIERPTIAVLGLNPHASDNGVIGDEEEKIIRPVIIEAKKKGMLVVGPFPADGFFGSGEYKKYDGILAMYHDQGLVPFKLLSFGKGVNFTAGLNAVRTSPDHGTAFDIAGSNLADPSSFRKALFAAIDIARNRKEYYEFRENALVSKTSKLQDQEDEVLEEDKE